MDLNPVNLSVTRPSAKGVCSQRLTAPAAQNASGPHRMTGGGRNAPWTSWGLRHHTGGLFHDGKADPGLVAVLFRDFAPAVFGLLAGLERTFDLGGAFHELVEVHRTELAADHPEIAAMLHESLLYSAA